MTWAFYFVFDDKDLSKRYPERISLGITKLLGWSRVKEIFKKDDRGPAVFPGLIIGFWSGVQENKCLPELKEETVEQLE